MIVVPMGVLSLPVVRPDAKQKLEARRRLVVTSVACLVLGIVGGAFAAILGMVWVDIALAAYVVIIALVTGVLLGIGVHARSRQRES
jgi:hypothetical protein